MKKIVLFFLMFAHVIGMLAEGFPQISNSEQEFWYYLKFTQGSFVVGSNGDGTVCKALIPTGSDTQLWKVEGSSTGGYTFTNKLGLKLYVSGTSQGSEVRAATKTTTLYRFKITTRNNNYIITPSSNGSQAFNVWGGMGLRNDIKLYSASDANAPMEFIAEDEMSFKNSEVKIIPYPASLTMGEGRLEMKNIKVITVPGSWTGTPSLSALAQRFADDLQRTAGIAVDVKNAEDAQGTDDLSISLKSSTSEAMASEAYALTITATGITVEAVDYGGFFNALQTLRQLMPAAIYGEEAASQEDWTVPCLTINDVPAMSHRGFHFDISRHFFNKEEVKKLLDAASTYKLNRFHWHLTDDQGWRVEIPEYPLLTTIGAVRKKSLTVYDPSSGISFYDDTEYGHGCYYTLDDLREVVAYAAERNIQIIPEIDMPGHMTACIVAYPELGCDPTKKIEVMTEGGVSRDILNLGKPATIDFLKCVLGHIAEVFPYELIHIGGDECPTAAWQSNADCQQLIKDEGLNGVGDLQPWLVEQLGSYLRDKYGKTVVVWDELLQNWKNNYTVKPVVMSWRGVEYAKQAADRGLQSIMVPTRPLYFDLLQCNPDQLEIDCPYMGGYGDGSVNTVEKVYNFDPRSTVSGREEYVIGTQANLWTESCTSLREAEYQYYPRLLALSEIAWLPKDKKDFLSFYNRLQQQDEVLTAKHITYAPHYFEPKVLTSAEAAIAEAEDILANSNPDAVGYPQQEVADALRAALEDVKASPDDDAKLATLNTTLADYKSAPIILPKADCLYKIVSASTYFRNRFNGSSLYVKDGGALGIHYTQQTEPEEAWQFVPQEDGTFQIVNAMTGKAITLLKTAGKETKADQQQGSSITIRKATKAAGGYTYIPGVLNIKNGKQNLYAKIEGSTLTLVSNPDSALCYPGTWRIEEITDYRVWMEKLISKAERSLEEAEAIDLLPGEEAGLAFLSNDVIAAGRSCLAQEEVSQQEYLDIVAAYAKYKAMTVVDYIDTDYYYLIQNVYYDTYYATANPNTNGVLPKMLTDDDTFRWFFVKNDDGTASICNKKTQTAAYVEESAEEVRVRLGKEYPWTLRKVKTDLGDTGIAIIDASATYSWYTNPRSWAYVLLKPYDWGASIWQLVQTDEKITAIREVKANGQTTVDNAIIYDLSGRQIANRKSTDSKLPRGIYIVNHQKVVIK